MPFPSFIRPSTRLSIHRLAGWLAGWASRLHSSAPPSLPPLTPTHQTTPRHRDETPPPLDRAGAQHRYSLLLPLPLPLFSLPPAAACTASPEEEAPLPPASALGAGCSYVDSGGSKQLATSSSPPPPPPARLLNHLRPNCGAHCSFISSLLMRSYSVGYFSLRSRSADAVVAAAAAGGGVWMSSGGCLRLTPFPRRLGGGSQRVRRPRLSPKRLHSSIHVPIPLAETAPQRLNLDREQQPFGA